VTDCSSCIAIATLTPGNSCLIIPRCQHSKSGIGKSPAAALYFYILGVKNEIHRHWNEDPISDPEYFNGCSKLVSQSVRSAFITLLMRANNI